MDLRMFYQKIRAIEEQLADFHVVVVSVETPDGGKPGVRTEVHRAQAAKLVVEGKARIATPDEAQDYRESVSAIYRAREAEQAASRLKVNVISDADLEALRSSVRKQK